MTPRLMGIVNANPDSFSGPGARALDELVADALAQVEAGADVILPSGHDHRWCMAVVSSCREMLG